MTAIPTPFIPQMDFLISKNVGTSMDAFHLATTSNAFCSAPPIRIPYTACNAASSDPLRVYNRIGTISLENFPERLLLLERSSTPFFSSYSIIPSATFQRTIWFRLPEPSSTNEFAYDLNNTVYGALLQDLYHLRGLEFRGLLRDFCRNDIPTNSGFYDPNDIIQNYGVVQTDTRNHVRYDSADDDDLG
ncbi:hypothetical protein DICVIV_02282 [Dictyocaulus viviparus]|uniref:Uncharacterized protein n=1 Tax=Dictyocaulus viviparus TaxID=29172 RepID=A0A0D8Y494_DICVI|nr:hypothetical protein DICVIV_02282 [Dictyocaulus viviparus]